MEVAQIIPLDPVSESSADSLLSFPPELLYSVFDCLAGDARTLSTCSLVSSAWQKMVQPSVFTTIFIFITTPHRSLHAFSEFLASRVSLLRCVRYVAVRPRTFENEPQKRMDLHHLHAILAKLPPLQQLSLIQVDIHMDLSIDHSSVTPSTQKNIGVLRLSHVTIYHASGKRLDSLLYLFGFFSAIGVLSLCDVWIQCTDSVAPPLVASSVDSTVKPRPRVEALDLEDTYFTYASVQDFIASFSSGITTVRAYYALRWNSSVYANYDTLFKSMSSSLKFLQICIPTGEFVTSNVDIGLV